MQTKIEDEIRLQGLGLSPGIIVARVCLYNDTKHEKLPEETVSTLGFTSEKSRFDSAVKTVIEQLDRLQKTVAIKLGRAEAEIFAAQKMIVADPESLKMINQELLDGYNAETAVYRTFDYFESQLLELDDAYMNERASDIGEIKRRLLDVLSDTRPAFQCAISEKCRHGRDRIVIASQLTPTMSVDMETDRILGFVIEHGSEMSHAAILARAIGIPAVSGIPNIQNMVPCSTEVMINGDSGEVIIHPSESTKQGMDITAKPAIPQGVVAPIQSLQVMANISVAADAKHAKDMEAEGIGLYRTEFEFFTKNRLLEEDEQFDLYRQVMEQMDGLPVYFRLIDIGADKTSPIFNLPPEENPALGNRGARLLLKRPDLLKNQARALVRASAYGNLKVLYPMITSYDQFEQLKANFNKQTSDLDNSKISHGVMFEVPSACLDADRLLESADFASIGTNDLVQYMFAVDRNNEDVASDYSYDNSIFWSLLEMLAKAAKAHNKPLSLCGELASNPNMVPRLISIGINTVSMNARQIPSIRTAISGE